MPFSIVLKAPSAVAFNIFGFDIRYYGIMLFLGMVFGLFVTYNIAKKYYKNVNLDILLDFFPWLIVISLISARLYYVLLSLDFYSKYPSEIFALWHGGISIHGAILGGFIAGFVYFKIIKKTSLMPYADAVSYGLALGQAIGRWGNFFNQEAFGIPSDLPLKLYIEPVFRPNQFINYEYFHPAFLYESLWDIFVFIILCFLLKKYPAKPNGVAFFTYLALYSFGRIFIEKIRVDSVLDVNNWPIALLISVLCLLASLIALIFITYKNKKGLKT